MAALNRGTAAPGEGGTQPAPAGHGAGDPDRDDPGARLRGAESEADEVRKLFEAAVLASQVTAEHGDPTEVALVTAAVRLGLDPEKVRAAHVLMAAYPFDSFRKRRTLVRAADGGAVTYVKGAPKETLALCDSIRWGDRTIAITEEVRRAMLVDHDRLAADGLRIPRRRSAARRGCAARPAAERDSSAR